MKSIASASGEEAERHAVVVHRDVDAVEQAQPAELEEVGARRDPEDLGLVDRRRRAPCARGRARVGRSPRARASSVRLWSRFPDGAPPGAT